MEFWNDANQLIKQFEEVITHHKEVKSGTKLYTGVDLGTAYIVLAVIDESGQPVAGAMKYAEVVKDGLVVDFIGAINIVKELKNEIEEKLGVELNTAATAYPPGTIGGDRKAIQHVVESGGFDVAVLVDEPSAANQVLKIQNGAVVDIGGGTVGIAVLNNSEVIYVADEPTGGTHFSLVIAGNYGISFGEAEQLKTNPEKQKELFPVVKPVMEKIASVIGRHVKDCYVDKLYLAGGTCCFPGIETVIGNELGIPIWKPDNPFLVTPLGIALCARSIQGGQV